MSQVPYEAPARIENHASIARDDPVTAWLTSGAPISRPVGAAEVVSVPLTAAPEAIAELAQCLTDEERVRAGRFAFERDRRRFIVARAWLRRLLASRVDLRPESVEIAYGSHGKPAIAARSRGPLFSFNVSHSEDVAVYAFARGREIGIDVEAVRAIEDADAIAGRFFSARESDAYRALHSRDKPLGFFNCWTRKEAFVKAIGDGLSHPLDSFDVTLVPGEPARILRVGSVPGERCGWHLESFSPAPGFVAAVVYAVRRS